MDKSVREEAIRTELLGVLGLEKFEKKFWSLVVRSSSMDLLYSMNNG
jgi:hypothetical protein